jgi:hypothetical protein
MTHDAEAEKGDATHCVARSGGGWIVHWGCFSAGGEIGEIHYVSDIDPARPCAVAGKPARAKRNYQPGRWI